MKNSASRGECFEICRILHILRKPNSIIAFIIIHSKSRLSSLKLVNSTRGHFSHCRMEKPCAQVF